MIGKDEIAKLIPHAGAMCLLEQVLWWNSTAISCKAISHTDDSNPLRGDGMLSALCGIEYAAQAMALHGALGDAIAQRPRAGYLVSVRDVSVHVERLDTLATPLTIKVKKVMGDGKQVIYTFGIGAGDQFLIGGRAAVILEVDPR